MVNAENAERQWRLFGTFWFSFFQCGVVNAENAERQWRPRINTVGGFGLLPCVVNAENAERQWRRQGAGWHNAIANRVVNAENAERQWRRILIRTDKCL